MTTGELRLTVNKINGRHIFEDSYVSGAFKIGKTVWRQGIPLYYLLHVGGGYISGDSYKQDISVLKNAALYLTTQAATKVYKGTTPANVETTIQLAENSHLSLLQDPLILYENARFHQRTMINMASSSTLHYSEIFTPGWSPTEELFAYEELFNELSITIEGKRFYVDRLYWTRGIQQQMLHLGYYTHLASYICIDTISEDIYEELLAIQAEDCTIGISRLEKKGFVLKVAGMSSQTLESVIMQVDNIVRACRAWEPLQLRKY